MKHMIDGSERKNPERGLSRVRYICLCTWKTDWQVNAEFANQQFEHHLRQMKEGENAD